jgi:hypothetical protein
MRLYFLFVWLCVSWFNLHSQVSELELKLYELPDVIFKAIDVPLGFKAAYELRIKQAVDHTDSTKGFFYQRAFLSHKGFNKPTIMITEGYDQPINVKSELSYLLGANQLVIEHRYFGQSLPEEMDYNFLNLEQATADLHHINSLFKLIYSGKWLSTGISKGGQTTIYYRYFYPNDVDVSIPYVAPFNLSFEDERIYNFLDTVGTDQCRQSLQEVQLRLLQKREDAIKLLRWYSYGAGLSFTYLTLEEAFEYTVLEYPFSFWQWGFSCSDIPDKSASLEELLVHMLNIVNIDFFSDIDMQRYASHYYQAATEMGYYGYKTDSVKEYLKALADKPELSAVFVPDKMKVEYKGQLANTVYEWLKKNGDKFIYIYGASDTWSATAIPENKDRDALWFFMKGKDHSNARIKYMTDTEKDLLINTLERWLNLSIDANILIDWQQ